MTTNSYLEYFLTLLGWVVNNGLWHMLIATGLFTLPLVVSRPHRSERPGPCTG
ncbi:hypothetical protein BDD26_0644 [Xenorhabdus cabanillasii]|uniref:Uncharacterized protein n=1 Tax=Xenorhabdus cabanillasii TaxID=351673 RepID=A0A3D9UHF2_9GAMM|nr:hypothetical protein [Xenorhabdus cabanillasii]REF26075.1 hypothetical protein BDD26_0644 [Xenorhabdus cabanillasii]